MKISNLAFVFFHPNGLLAKGASIYTFQVFGSTERKLWSVKKKSRMTSAISNEKILSEKMQLRF